MSEHAKLSPSSSDRWLACPASIVRAPETEDEGSEYAQEGTAAHALAEHCLKNGISAHAPTFPAGHEKYDSFELRDHVVHLFGTPAELHATELGDDELEVFYFGLLSTDHRLE